MRLTYVPPKLVQTEYALPRKGLPVTSSTHERFLSVLLPPTYANEDQLLPLLVEYAAEVPAAPIPENPSLPGHELDDDQIQIPGSPLFPDVPIRSLPIQFTPPLLVKQKPVPYEVPDEFQEA